MLRRYFGVCFYFKWKVFKVSRHSEHVDSLSLTVSLLPEYSSVIISGHLPLLGLGNH